MNIKKISSLFTYSSYESKLDQNNTVIAINKINELIYLYINERFNPIKLTTPILYSRGSGFNDVNTAIHPPKVVLLNKTGILIELASGFRKWSLITSQNLEVKSNDCLYAKGTVIKCSGNLDIFQPPSNEELVLTFPIIADSDLQDIHTEFCNIFLGLYLYLKKEIERQYPSLLKTKNFEVKTVLIRDLNFFNFKLFNQSIFDKFYGEQDNILIKKIPPRNKKLIPYFFQDIYDYNYFARFYKMNPYTNEIVNVAEITISCNYGNLLQQKIRQEHIRDLSDYEKLLKRNQLSRYIQIKINLSNLYMIMLEKIHNCEVNPSTWDDNTYEEIIANRIKAL